MNDNGVGLLHWANLIFLLPMGVAMLLLALSALNSGGEDSDGDALANAQTAPAAEAEITRK